MNKLLHLLFWAFFGAVGLTIGLAGIPLGWLFLVVSAWSIIATIRPQSRREDGKEVQGDSGGGFNLDIGGCGGYGG